MAKPTKKDIQAFVKTWQGRGDEKQDSTTFWTNFLVQCLGVIPETIPSFARFEKPVKGKAPSGKTGTRYIDVLIPDHRVLIEQKSQDKPLDKARDNGIWGWETPFQQARWYSNNLPYSLRPRWIITCNFQTFRLYDLENDVPEDNYIEVHLEELPDKIHLFQFIQSSQTSRIHEEQELSFEAGKRVTRLYDALAKCYKRLDTSAEEQRSLNVVITRFVFLLYAEDAGLLQTHDAFGDYCQGNPASLRDRVIRLFETLDTPEEERDPYLDERAAAFPYVNGGLFHDRTIIVPQLDAEVAVTIAEVSKGFDWNDISPVIFGGVFEGTLNPETRRAGGMHYTSIENIDRCLRPLFLDDFWDELHEAEGIKSESLRLKRLNALHDKIADFTLGDPACGSGNFLSRAYTQLREIENQILADKAAAESGSEGQTGLSLEGDADPIRVRLSHFYGIEINDFAVSVAKTSLWIAEEQMLAKTQEIMPGYRFDFLPLRSNESIVEGDALEIEWHNVFPKDLSALAGNPPFVGARFQSPAQKAQVMRVFDGKKNAGNIDYCAAWYMKAAQFMEVTPCHAALVSTNSICQGEQVANIWKPLHDMGVQIDFAHTTFRWDNEAENKAHVFCVIVGFNRGNVYRTKTLYVHDTPDSEARVTHPKQINAYLSDAPDAFVWNRSKPLCRVPEIGIGSQPIDNGNYLFTDEEKAEFLRREPGSERFFHPWLGSKEFLHGYTRWCLWLGEATWKDLKDLPLCRERIENVREYRHTSKRKQTLAAAERPAHFGTEIIPNSTSILIPEVSSQRRRYIPIGFIGPETLCSNLVRLAPNATLYHFGVLHSQMHNAWMRTVAGRLKSDYRYSAGVVYNNFVWPEIGEAEKGEIAELAQGVLDARKLYDGATLADLYDPNNETFFPELMAAHRKLDAAVERAYGVEFDGDEEKIVAHLFKLYAEKTAGEK